MKITVIGTGYVGLIAGLGFAKLGHSVTCFDNNSEKINSLNANEMPFYEAQATGMLKRFRNKKINQRTKPPLIVFKSTLPIGSHLKSSKQFPKLNLVTNPEFLKIGNDSAINFWRPKYVQTRFRKSTSHPCSVDPCGNFNNWNQAHADLPARSS